MMMMMRVEDTHEEELCSCRRRRYPLLERPAFRLVFDEKNKYKEEVALKNGLPPFWRVQRRARRGRRVLLVPIRIIWNREKTTWTDAKGAQYVRANVSMGDIER